MIQALSFMFLTLLVILLSFQNSVGEDKAYLAVKRKEDAEEDEVTNDDADVYP